MRLVLVSPKKITIEKSLRLGFSAINNEYEALLVGMAMVQRMGRKTMEMFFGLKVGRRPGEGRVRSKRCENVRVLESS